MVDALGVHSAEAVEAVRGLTELLPWEGGRRAAVCVLACMPGTLSRILDLVRVRATLVSSLHQTTPERCRS